MYNTNISRHSKNKITSAKKNSNHDTSVDGLRKCGAPLFLMTYSIHQTAFSNPVSFSSAKSPATSTAFFLYLDNQ